MSFSTKTTGHLRDAQLFCKKMYYKLNKLPSPEMEIYLNNPFYENYIKYLQGNPMRNRDLERA